MSSASIILKFIYEDPLDLIKTLTIIDKDGKLNDLSNLHSEQLEIISSVVSGSSIVVLKARQIGSSTACLAALFYTWLLSDEPIHIVILSHKQSSSKELLNKIKTMYEGLPQEIKLLKPCDITSTQLVLKGSGARFSAKGARDAGGLRSFTCTHLLLSELPFMDNPDELLATALSALNNGQLIVESTANYYGDALHRLITKTQLGETGYKFLFFDWTHHKEYQAPALEPIKDITPEEKGLTPEQITWRRQTIARMNGDVARFKREYPRTIEEAYSQLAGCFIDDQHLSKLEQLKAAKDRVCRFEAPKEDTRYVIGVDPAMGLNQDYSSIHVLNCRTLRTAAVYRSNTTPLHKLADVIAGLSYEYGINAPNQKAVVHIESNAEGLACVQRLESLGVPLYTENGKLWKTNASNKAILLERVKQSILGESLKSIDDITYTELRSVQIDNIGRLDIPKSLDSHADGIISLGLALLISDKVSLPNIQVQPTHAMFKPGKLRNR